MNEALRIGYCLYREKFVGNFTTLLQLKEVTRILSEISGSYGDEYDFEVGRILGYRIVL